MAGEAQLFAVLLLLGGCRVDLSEENPSPPSPPPTSYVFQMKTIEQTLDGCTAGAEGCTYLRLDFLMITDAADGVAVDAITEAVHGFITEPPQPDGAGDTAKELIDEFFASYAEMRRQVASYELPWFLERKAFAVNNAPDILCVSFASRSFMGGAHGNVTIAFENFNPRTGERVELADLFVSSYEAKLLLLAEARFREVRAIEEGMTLADAGFSFSENGTFTLPDNFAVEKDGLSFYYNAYEVAPYALGATELTLSYEELDGLWKE